MISRMKKITVICMREYQETTLHELQKMGVLHVEHVREPGGTLLEETRSHLSDMQRACDMLEHYAKQRESAEAPPDPDQVNRSPDHVVDEVWKLINQRKDHQDALEEWKREAQRIEPFGSFNPAQMEELAAQHIYVHLYKAGPKQEINVPDAASLTVHRQDNHGVYFSVFSREPLDLPYEEIAPPRKSLEEIRSQIARLEQSLAENERVFMRLTRYLPMIRELLHQAEDRTRFLEARTGMEDVNALAYLRGYCPKRDADKIRAEAKTNGWGVVVEKVKETDRVPTRIENPRWVKPIRPVFNFIGVVPGYNEVDISAVFLLFLSLFFGMIIGDAGYGALFLGATFWARRKFPQAPAPVFNLLYITSAATLIWGALTGNYFGITTALPGVFQAVRIDWLGKTENIMYLCFLIGAIHLTIAHAWNVYRNRHSLQALAQVGWICIVWCMFFLACFLVLNAEFPPVMVPVFSVGLVLLVLFMTPVHQLKSDWINHVMLPLNLVSNFVDVVSYVRLFAVGTATLAVASAFNDMAMEVGASGWIGTLFAILIIFLGHTLNILLAAMGVLVHGIRLNTLEFAGHLGLQWTGLRFQPFMRKSERVPLLDDEMQATHNDT